VGISIEERVAARKPIQDFFADKRKNLSVGGIWDFSLENRIKRQFLAEMNGIAKDLEMEAMSKAEKGKDGESVLKKAEEKFKKLQEDFTKNLGHGDPIIGKPYEKIIEIINGL